MKHRLMSVFLVMLLIFGIGGGQRVSAAASDAKVIFRGTNVKGNADTLELSLFVKTENGELFKSVSTVIEVDNTVLEIMPWSTDESYNLSSAADWDNAVSIETEKANRFFSAGAVAYKDNDKTYINITAESYYPVSLSEENRIAVIRFNYAAGKNKSDVVMKESIKLAEDNSVVYSSAAQHGMIYFTDDNTYYCRPLTEDSEGNAIEDTEIPEDMRIEPLWDETVSEGESAAGTGSKGEYFPVVFYDWDGTTLLGAKIVEKVADETEQQALVDEALKEFAASQMSESNKAAYLSEGYNPSKGTDAAYYDESKPLSNKKGYTFGKWIDFDAKDENGNEVYTSYGSAVEVKDATTPPIEIAEPAGYSFSPDDYSGIILKAAYATNADMVDLTDSADYTVRRYTVTPIAYTRFDASDSYSISFRVDRGKVHRVREPGLRVSMQLEGADAPVYSLQRLTNRDSVITEVAANDKLVSVSAEVIDLCSAEELGGTAAWATASAARSDINKVSAAEKSGFIILGNVGFINGLLSKASTINDLAELKYVHLTTATFTLGSGAPAVKLRRAKERMLAMYQSLPSKRDLTWDEMQEAIINATVWNSEANAWTNGFTGTYIQ